MPQHSKNLGRLISVHTVEPVFVQRAIFISVLSFLFFLGMMFAFYLRQNIGYFLLATAFLLIYLVMMFSLFSQRRSAVRIFERGLEYRFGSLRWEDIKSVSDSNPIVITAKDCKPIELPTTIADPEALARHISYHIRPMG